MVPVREPQPLIWSGSVVVQLEVGGALVTEA